MPAIDHHSKPYDQGTLTKLEIFEHYVETWLPTFIKQGYIKEINIVDFFAGLGYDCNGVKGSPIRTLDLINNYYDKLLIDNTIINLYLNEFDKSKFIKLESSCEEYLKRNSRLNKFVKIHFYNDDFDNIYDEIIDKTRDIPSLFIIDQCGIKFTSEENFNKLQKLKKTDFLFFISSSYFNRFSKSDEFLKHLNIDYNEIKKNPYKFIHRIVIDAYRNLIPKESDLRLYPFSIKKTPNIYGIIFGSNHILGVEKFLQIAWKKNKLNGEANYDIDEDKGKKQFEFNFDTGGLSKQLTKIEKFEKDLEEFIKERGNVTNIDLYYFTYQHGHIAKHATEHLRKLKQKKIISYAGHTKISWTQVRDQNIVEFKWNK